MSIARAKKIKLLLFDVDGVATDGKIWLFPVPNGAQQTTQGAAADKADAGGYVIVSQTAMEAKGFHAHDGAGISLARLAGMKVGLITKRISETVALRGRDLRLDYVMQGIADKRGAFEKILAAEGLQPEEAAFIGDDIIDLPVMRICGLAFSVPNGRPETKREAHVITEHAGGDGALRDAIEYILRAQDKLDEVIEAYLHERDAVMQ